MKMTEIRNKFSIVSQFRLQIKFEIKKKSNLVVSNFQVKFGEIKNVVVRHLEQPPSPLYPYWTVTLKRTKPKHFSLIYHICGFLEIKHLIFTIKYNYLCQESN